MPAYSRIIMGWKLHCKLRRTLCRLGIHDPCDIHEIDASVYRAECMGCQTLVKARQPRPADPKEVERWEKWGEESWKYSEAIDEYLYNDGPCPFCIPPEGEKHAYTCWEAD
jgi:hypothetical protein